MIRTSLSHRIGGVPRAGAVVAVVAALLAGLVGVLPLKADPLVHRFSINDVTVQEGNTTNAPEPPATDPRNKLTFKVTLNAPSPTEVRVTYGVATDATGPGTARVGVDYENSGGELVFPPTVTSMDAVFVIKGDTHVEPPETVRVLLSNPVNASIADGEGIGTIENDDVGSPSSITVNDVAVNEGTPATGQPATTPATFTVSLDRPTTQDVQVDYALTAGGSPAATLTGDGADVTLTSGTLTIPAGDTSKPLTAAIAKDTSDEFNENFNLTLSKPDNAVLQDAVGAGRIDNDDAAPSLRVVEKTPPDPDTNDPGHTDVRKNEGNSGTTQFDFVVELRDVKGNLVTSGKGVQVDVATQNDTATSGSDYTAVSQTLVFGTDKNSIDVNVPVTGDTTVEPNEKFNVRLQDPDNATIAGGLATGTIVDDDGLGPRVTIVSPDADPDLAGNQPFEEGDAGTSSVSIKVSIPTAPTSVATVGYKTTSDTANTSDYVAETGTITWQPTDTGTALTKTITVDIVGDTSDEANEQFYVDLENPNGVTLGSTTAEKRAIVGIEDDDAGPQLSVNSVTVTEPDTAGNVTASFTVTLSPASGQTVTVTAATADDTATGGTGPAFDYVTKSQNLTFLATETSKTFDVVVNGDNDAEPKERFLVNLTNPSGATIAPGGSPGTGSINNDDGAAPTVSISDATVTEGNSGNVNAAFTVTRSAVTAQTVTVRYSTANGSARADETVDSTTTQYDYQPATNQSVTFQPGMSTVTINVPVHGDVSDEDNETFLVNLLSASNASLDPDLAQRTGQGTITDDDTEPVKVSVGDATAVEPDTGTTNLEVPVTLAARPGRVVTVDYATSNGTATQPGDYTARSGTLTWAVDADPTQTILVPIKGDTTDEADETITITLSDPSNATIEDGTGVGTISDNDASPALSIADSSSNEANSPMVFTVTLSAASGQSVTVNYATSDGTETNKAVAGSDYTSTSGTLTFAAGDTSETISVPITNDSVDEADEVFTVTLSGPTNATLADPTGTGTVLDNDGAGELSVSDATVTEGNSGTTTLSFIVRLKTASNKVVSATYATENGTAGAGSDYVQKSGTVSIPAGETQATVDVTVNGDTAPEGDETMFLRLSAPSNATLTDSLGQGRILSDDPRGEVTVGPGGGGGPHVRRFNSIGGDERFGFMAGSGTETAGATVARADVDDDGIDEVITGTNAGGEPRVRVFKADGTLMHSFLAYASGFRGGVNVAAGEFDDVPGADIVTGPGAGGGPHVRIFEPDGTEIGGFMAYAEIFTGGVFVAAGDLDGDGFGDLATGPGAGGGPHVKVFYGDGSDDEFFPYPQAFTGGVRVAIGGDDDEGWLITGAGPGGGPHVGVYKYNDGTGELISQGGGFYAYDPKFGNGITVAAGDIDHDGTIDIVTGAGPGGGPHVQAFRTSTRTAFGPGFMAYKCDSFPSACFTNGVWVAVGTA